MDPYLEDDALWPSFHHEFLRCLQQILQPSLIDRYGSRVKKRHYVTEGELSTSGERNEHHEGYLEIHNRCDGRLITLVDVVSPANKLTAAGRAAYLAKRAEAKNANASLVEIDLVLQGQPTLEYSRDGLPDWDYAVTVVRSTHPDRFEIYTATLQKRLPRFRLPLASDDRDMVIDLPTAFTRCYDQGRIAKKIDYRSEPPVQVDEEDRRWIECLLTEKRFREWRPSHDEIARVAYLLWEREGCLHGHDKEHWHQAIEQLKKARSSHSAGG
jgi:hypothetical protein